MIKLNDVFTPEVLSIAKSIRCKSISHIKDEDDEIFYQAIIWDVTLEKFTMRFKYVTNKAKFKDQIKDVLYKDYNIEARSSIVGVVDLYDKESREFYDSSDLNDEMVTLLNVLKEAIERGPND